MKGGKIIAGAAILICLVGIGYGAWHINGGFGADSSMALIPGIETEVKDSRIINSLAVTSLDDKLWFANEAEQDLNVSYKVKALEEQGSLYDPYSYIHEGGYIEILQEPNLKVSVKALDKNTNNPLEETNNFYKYYKLPSTQLISYQDWLNYKYKDTEGYQVNLTFNWGDYFEGKNPQEYWKLSGVDQFKANIKMLADTLKQVKLIINFSVVSEEIK